MKKLIKAATTISGKSIENAKNDCYDYLENCFDRSPDVVEYEFIRSSIATDLDTEIMDGVVQSTMFAFRFQIDKTKILIRTFGACCNNEFLGFTDAYINIAADYDERVYSFRPQARMNYFNWREQTIKNKDSNQTKESVKDQLNLCDSIEKLIPYSRLIRIFRTVSDINVGYSKEDIIKWIDDNDLIAEATELANDYTRLSGEKFRKHCFKYIKDKLDRKFKGHFRNAEDQSEIDEYIRNSLEPYGQGWEDEE